MKYRRSKKQMPWIDVFRIATRMLLTNLLRSLLTTLGIGVAISFIVILIGLGYGLQTITIGSIVQSKALLSLDIQTGGKEVQLTDETVTEIEKLSGVAVVSPVVITRGQLTVNDKLAAVALTAGNEKFLEMEGVNIRQGRAYRDGTTEAVITPPALDLLDTSIDTVLDKSFRLAYDDPNNQSETKTIDAITIVGIADNTESPALYLPYDSLTKEGPIKITTVKVLADERDSVISIRDTATTQGYQVDSLIETLDQARLIFRWVTIGLSVFGAIALFVAAIGMFNTLTIALIERTREIGIMKAIGVTNQAVMRLFLAEASIIGFLGGVTGIVIGVGIETIVEIALQQMAKLFDGTELNLFQHPFGFLPSMIIFPVVLAVITGFYPAIRASHLNPLRALKFE